ncbi:hypothetical protein HF923_13905 [Acidithiobacillus ferriphilus]|jgi:hypothetical protein|nr:hypothetical protein [Acidithiobacillus ferriphilus]MBU2846868.1 hypothetical protein [Acidithiobacillus ferriphilus]
MGKKVQSYTAEFRAEAVKLVLAQGFSLQGLHSGFQCPRGHWLTGCQSPWSEACRYPWSVVAELEGENKQFRKELAQMRMERDFVKKAAAYFTLPGNRCKVRAHEGVAKPIPHNGHGQSARYIEPPWVWWRLQPLREWSHG